MAGGAEAHRWGLISRSLSLPVVYLHTAQGKAITWNKEQGKGACGICDSFWWPFSGVAGRARIAAQPRTSARSLGRSKAPRCLLPLAFLVASVWIFDRHWSRIWQGALQPQPPQDRVIWRCTKPGIRAFPPTHCLTFLTTLATTNL